LFEGLDRTGKTTQVKRLVDHFNATLASSFSSTSTSSSSSSSCSPSSSISVPPVIHARYPDRSTPSGQQIDLYLRNSAELDDETIHHLFVVNRKEANSQLIDSLKSGHHVICDRYSYSGIAFSTAKGKLSYDWCKEQEKGLIKPDLIFYLTVDPMIAAKRGGFGDERYETKEMQEKVKIVFERLKEEEKNEGRWIEIDAGREMDQITQQLITIAQKRMDEIGDKPITFF